MATVAPVPKYLSRSGETGLLSYLLAAIVLHAAVFGLLLIEQHAHPGGYISSKILVYNLVPPGEGVDPIFMASSNPQAALPPVGQDQLPDADITSGGDLDSPIANTAADVSDAELAEVLAAERDALREELKQLTETALASDVPHKPLPMPPPDSGQEGQGGPGPEGAVRELDLSGYPQPVVDDIMNRYKLKVVTRRLEGGKRGQNFLSSASRGNSEQYFGGQHNVPAGVYEVFQLSRDSVAHMSSLEEKALKEQGLEPLKARVVRIVFGIVKSGESEYELGVKSLEAEPVP